MKSFARALAALAVLTATACGSHDPMEQPMDKDEKAATQQFNQLMQRPDIEQVTARYDAMYRKIREQLTATVPTLRWEQTIPPGRSGCGHEFGAIDVAGRADAEQRGLGNWMARGNLPDARWDEAVSVVDRIARSYGFDSGPIVVKNKPSDHYVTFHDPYGAELVLGTAVNTAMTLGTGCHLTAEAKKRGTLAPTPTY